MHIYLVRHTEYSNPKGVYAFHLPFTLSRKGKNHAAKIGEWLNKKGNSLPIYTSSIKRCVQTSEIIASKTNSIIRRDERLIEVYCPNLQGKKKPTKNEDSWKLEEDDLSREPWLKTLRRMINLFKEKVSLGEDCIFVSHGEPLTLLYYHLIDKKPRKYLWDPKNKNKVILKGMIVDIEVDNDNILSVKKNEVIVHSS